MADGGRAPGPEFVENESDALAKPYELTHPLSAEGVANIDDMFRLLFDSVREREAEIVAVEEDVEELQAAPASTAEVLVETLTLSEAQLEAFTGVDATGIDIVAAPGANKILVPITFAAEVIVTSNYTNTPALELHFSGAGLVLGTVTGFAFGATGSKFDSVAVSPSVSIAGTNDYKNKALRVYLAAALTGVGSATAKVSVVYYVFDVAP